MIDNNNQCTNFRYFIFDNLIIIKMNSSLMLTNLQY
jgi:hypothetical protein